MESIGRIINLISVAISARLSYTLSQQIARSQGHQGHVSPPGWFNSLLHKVGLGSPATWAERFNLGKPSPQNQARLAGSQRGLNAAMQAHTDAMANRNRAQNELDEERRSPTGKNMVDLQVALIDYEAALQQATKVLHTTSTAHNRLKTEITRQTQWQAARAKQKLWSPRQQWAKTQQAFRIARRRWDRARAARQDLSAAQKTHSANLARQRATQRRYQRAQAKYRSVQGRGTPVQQLSALRNARVAAAGWRMSIQDSRASGAALSAARGGASLATSAAVGGAATAVGMIIKPVGLAIAVVAATVIAAKAYINRQLQKSEQLIEGQIQERSQFSAQISGAMARYRLQEFQLGMRTAAATSESASGVVRSTTALKEAQQPKNAAWEDIGNRIQAAATDTATAMQQLLNQVDFITPLVQQSVKLLEWLPWVEKIADNTRKEMNVDMVAIQSAAKSNLAQRHLKNRSIPPIK
jgi:hypothetical protein